jgi:hypothetical protein
MKLHYLIALLFLGSLEVHAYRPPPWQEKPAELKNCKKYRTRNGYTFYSPCPGMAYYPTPQQQHEICANGYGRQYRSANTEDRRRKGRTTYTCIKQKYQNRAY